MKFNRRWHQFRAFIGGYFWLPCPICREPFGGHEVQPNHTLMNTTCSGTSVCPNCGDAARLLNQLMWEGKKKPCHDPIGQN